MHQNAFAGGELHRRSPDPLLDLGERVEKGGEPDYGRKRKERGKKGEGIVGREGRGRRENLGSLTVAQTTNDGYVPDNMLFHFR